MQSENAYWKKKRKCWPKNVYILLRLFNVRRQKLWDEVHTEVRSCSKCYSNVLSMPVKLTEI